MGNSVSGPDAYTINLTSENRLGGGQFANVYKVQKKGEIFSLLSISNFLRLVTSLFTLNSMCLVSWRSNSFMRALSFSSSCFNTFNSQFSVNSKAEST